MAGEIMTSYAHGATLVFLTWNNRTGQIWNTSTLSFEAYNSSNYLNYTTSMVELGTASHHYNGNFPTAIGPGNYGIECRAQIGGSPLETDPTVGEENFDWSGVQTMSLADIPVSGSVGSLPLIRLARGIQIQNFPVYLKSSADHITPFTSGVVSGQIARDAGPFGPLQSGAFTEIGLGWFNLQALTSGDLLANTVKLTFTANGISGGASDPLPLSFILQRSSGQN